MSTTPSFLAVQVRDTERSTAFYRDVLGFAVASEQPSTDAVVMDGALPFGRMIVITDPDGYRLTLHG